MSPRSDSLRFASLLVYTPRFRDPELEGDRPRQALGWVKGARPEAMRLVAVRCLDHQDGVLSGVFGADATLVPVPRSAPPKAGDTLWPGRSIAEALLAKGLGRDVQTLLVRATAVPQAHAGPASERPTVDVLARSLRWEGDLGTDIHRVVLVDDVVTRGTTFLAAQEVIHAMQPGLQIIGFAAIRTMSFSVVTEPMAPVQGTIVLTSSGHGRRIP